MLARQSAAPTIRLGLAVAPDSEIRSQQSWDDNKIKDRWDVRSQSVSKAPGLSLALDRLLSCDKQGAQERLRESIRPGRVKCP